MQLEDWLKVSGTLLVIFGLFLTVYQLKVNQDRSKREKAIDYILSWARNLDRKATLVRKLVEKFNREQCIKLHSQQMFYLELSYERDLEAVLGILPPIIEGKYEIDIKTSAELRWITVSYLNNLEAIISGWRHHVADREIISEQFKYLVSPSENHFILETFRNSLNDGRNYPSIAEFVECVKRDNLPKPRKLIFPY